MSKELWHYTSVDKCISILNSQEIWLSSFTKTNDATDCDWARNILWEYFLPKLTGNICGKTKIALMAARKPVKKEVIIKQEVQDRLDVIFKSLVNKDNRNSFDHYMFCTSHRCQKNGDDGILSMWRGYGNKNPVALVFDAQKLKHAVEKSFVRSSQGTVYLEPVIYPKQCSELGDKKSLLDSLEKAFLSENFDPKKDINSKDMQKLFESVYDLAVTVKHYGFYEEKEIRLVVTTTKPGENFLPDRYVISIGNKIFDCLSKIVLGPGMKKEEENIKAALKELKQNIRITCSTIPFLENPNK